MSFDDFLERYKHEPRTVVPLGRVFVPDLAVIKLYSMMKWDTAPRENVREPSALIFREITSGRILPYSGYGFAILSEDMLNVARWDANHPIVLRSDIYTYEKGDISTISCGDIRQLGSFCIWELGIVNHERDAWKQFLASNHKYEDKKFYLGDFFSGALK